MTDHDPADEPTRSAAGDRTEPLGGSTRPLSRPEAGDAAPEPRRRPRLPDVDPSDLPAYAAAGLVVAIIGLSFGALLVASSVEGIQDEWKATVKVIGLSSALGFSFGLAGGAMFAGLSLLAAQWLVRDRPTTRGGLASFVGIGTLAVGLWLSFFTVLGVVVDLTNFADDFVPAFGVLVSDLAALFLLLLAVVWGYQTFRSARA